VVSDVNPGVNRGRWEMFFKGRSSLEPGKMSYCSGDRPGMNRFGAGSRGKSCAARTGMEAGIGDSTN